MPKELPKAYDFNAYEDKIYKKWEKSGYFNPDVCVAKGVCKKDAKPFSIVLPPPNVTGNLHLGHAVMLAIQDIMIRYHRMKGDRTLWLPGTDHAAIATQSKVESILWNKEKKTKHDLGRDKFLARVEKFAQDSHDTIINQAKKIGASLDWSREVYTLDKERTLAVRTAFKRMYDDGLIYRGVRLVNWDPKMQTTVSDDEVEHREEKAPFYYLQYGPFVIATARPETKFGDKYVVMHPDDKRYKKYKHRQKVDLEWINGPITAIVIKDKSIDMEFGTGVMTITPWHDATDFEISERHNLDKEQIIDHVGKLLPIAGEFAGEEISSAREKIIAKLKKKGLLVKVDENYIHNAAINSRGNGVIEPQIMKQWFVDVNKEFKQSNKKTTLKKLMQAAVREEKIEIIPEKFKKTYFHWIDNLRDWNISRQIWFGHRIPVWYRGEEVYVGVKAPTGQDWKQDPDTLDTWFSSGMWTFSPLGWPSSAKASDGKPKPGSDLDIYHPMSVMETGYDILFFWVARMILMTTYLLEDIPFKTIYLHGLVRDEQGRKMSKSLDNTIDPLDVAKKYGTDAVRLSLVIGATPGNDVKLSEAKIAGYRNFSNKLWNISRYVLQETRDKKQETKINEKELTLADKWILTKLEYCIEEVTEDLERYHFSSAGEWLQAFTWNYLADWYLEATKFSKGSETEKVLLYVLRSILKLWHPFMPFVTEAIWKEFNNTDLIVESWPELNKKTDLKFPQDYNNFKILQDIIIEVRNARAANKIEPKKKIKAVIYSDKYKKLIESQIDLIKGLRTGISELEIKNKGPKFPNEIYITVNGIEIYLIGAIDKDKEKKRIAKRVKELEGVIKCLENKLNNKEFSAKAPKKIVVAEKEKLAKYKDEQKVISAQLKSL